MKKLILLLLLIPTSVFAINYSPFSNYYYSDTYVEETDLCEVDEIKKYKYYKDVIEYTEDYYNYDFIDENYIYRDEEYIYSDLISSLEKPNLDEVIDLEEKQYTYYQEYNKIKYVILYNFTYSKYLLINELILYDNNNVKLNYQVIQGPDSINDTESFSGGSQVYNDDVIILKLDKELNNTNFSLNFWVAGYYPSTFTLDYNLNASGNPDDKYYYGTLSGSLSSTDYYRVEGSKFSYKESLNDEIKVKEGYVESIKNAKIVKYETEYNYKEKLYKYYKFDREYLDDYYFETDIFDEEYLKDENEFKIVYRYRCRTILEDVVIPDKIVEDVITPDKIIEDIVTPDEIVEDIPIIDNDNKDDIDTFFVEEKENIKTNNKIENNNKIINSKNEIKENNVVVENNNISSSNLNNEEVIVEEIKPEYVNNDDLSNDVIIEENKPIYVNNRYYKYILIIVITSIVVLITKFKFKKGKKIWKRR